MERTIFFFVVTLSLLAFNSCKNDDDSFQESEQPATAETTSILFIGNSHTSFNGGLDAFVNGFAQSVSLQSNASRIAPGGFTLEDHLNSQATINAINSEDWDVIILQENTYRAAYETNLMQESIVQFSELLQTSASQIFLFKTWAYNGESEMDGLLSNAYSQASTTSGYRTIAIGNAWNTFKASHTINLYNDDAVHPNINGTYLTAALFFKKIFGYSNLNDIPYDGTLNQEAAATIRAFVTNQTI